MKNKLIIKLCKVRKSTKDKDTRLIVVGLNKSRSNGGFIEKLGVYSVYYEKFPLKYRAMKVCSVNLKRLGF
jgi:ribosomal protein S16